MKVNEYTKQADEFLTAHGMEFRAVLIGDDCPMFCTDAEKGIDMDKVNQFPRKTHIHGKHYRCTISAKGRRHFSIDFWNSYADEEHNYYTTPGKGRIAIWETQGLPASLAELEKKYRGKKPIKVTAYDVLATITKHDPGDFENFCSELDYDTDSRKAENVWRAVVKEWEKVSKFFTPEELEQVQEIN